MIDKGPEDKKLQTSNFHLSHGTNREDVYRRQRTKLWGSKTMKHWLRNSENQSHGLTKIAIVRICRSNVLLGLSIHVRVLPGSKMSIGKSKSLKMKNACCIFDLDYKLVF
jgi:hypothetical protein